MVTQRQVAYLFGFTESPFSAAKRVLRGYGETALGRKKVNNGGKAVENQFGN